MIEDIKLIGLDSSLINEIIDKLGYDTALNMACNHEKIKANINLLKSLNIKSINELLLNRNDLFFIETEKLTKKFSKFNIMNLSYLINEDYTVIDEIFN